MVLLPLGLSSLFSLAPLAQMGIERASGPESCIDGGTSEHGWDIFLDLGKWHNWSWIALGGMSELFQSGEGVFIGKIQDFLMRSDDLKIESGYSIEKSLIGSKNMLVHQADSLTSV